MSTLGVGRQDGYLICLARAQSANNDVEDANNRSADEFGEAGTQFGVRGRAAHEPSRGASEDRKIRLERPKAPRGGRCVLIKQLVLALFADRFGQKHSGSVDSCDVSKGALQVRLHYGVG